MSTNSTSIPKETARHVLWSFDQDGGWQPGSFTQLLLRALAAADVVNFNKLAVAYPDYAAAVHLAQYDETGIAQLQRIASGQGPLGCNCGDTAGPFTADGRCETCAGDAQ